MKKVAFKKQIQFKIIVNGGTIHNMYVLKCLNEVGVYLFFLRICWKDAVCFYMSLVYIVLQAHNRLLKAKKP